MQLVEDRHSGAVAPNGLAVDVADAACSPVTAALTSARCDDKGYSSQSARRLVIRARK
jgi:hypothetical protein